MKTKQHLSSISQGILLGILSLIIYSLIVEIWKLNLNILIDFRGDAILTSSFVKTVVQSGNFWSTSHYLGYPENYIWLQFPFYSPIFFITTWIFSKFTHNYALVVNLTYLTSIFLVSFTSYFVFRYLNLRRFFASIAALLYCFLPYHFLRGEAHLTLSAYYTVPCWIYLTLEHLRGNLCKSERWLPKTTFWNYALIFFLVIDIMYYWFFGLICLLMAGLLRSLQIRKLYPIAQAFCISIFVGIAAIILTTPALLYINTFGVNKDNISFQRSFVDTELYAIKITNLILPITSHHIPFMAKLSSYYFANAPLTGGSTAVLGLVGSIGFLILVFISLTGILYDKFSISLRELSLLNLTCLLTGMIGGFGTLIALFLFSGVRCYDRISVYIGFFSIAAFFILFQRLLLSSKIKAKYIYLIGIAILLFGLFDQSGKHPLVTTYRDYYINKAHYLELTTFVKQIETILPAHSAIFELPNMKWGETSNNVSYIYSFLPYLTSSSSYWSFGAMNGNPVSNWQFATAKMLNKTMLDRLIFAGFTGIFITRDAYTHHATKVEGMLNQLVGEKPIVSINNNYSFYDLRHYKIKRQTQMGITMWNNAIKQTTIDLFIKKDGRGFAKSTRNWVASVRPAKLILTNFSGKPITVKLTFSLTSHNNLPINISIPHSNIHETVISSSTPTVFSKNITLAIGETTLFFTKKMDMPYTLSNFNMHII